MNINTRHLEILFWVCWAAAVACALIAVALVL